MTSNPKKHIIDSLLREIYGEKSPPDQTDAILRRLESGDSSLITESDSASYDNDSGSYPTIRSETAAAGNSFATSWVVIAASVVFFVGLIGAMTKVLVQSGDNERVADSQKANGETENTGALKRSETLAVKEEDKNSDPSTGNNDTQLAQNENDANSTNGAKKDPLVDVENLTPNPLPTFAENAERMAIADVKSRIDQSLADNWHVHVIENPKSITKSEWVERVFQKTLGRKPEASELKKLGSYLSGNELPSTDIQLQIVESIMSDESTSREFAHYWADRFTKHLSGQVHHQISKPRQTPELGALKSFLRQAFLQKDPLDEIVSKLIHSTGSVDPQAIEFNGAAGFVALTGNDPNRLAENISRSFLGTELTCAKCHADMVHEQSRTDYLGLVSFLQGMNVTRKQTGVAVVSESATKRKVPGLFYSNRSGLAVYAAPLIAGHDAALDQTNGRKSLAEQLVRSDRFAKAMVNWVWTEIYGYGLSREGRINQTVNAPHQLLMAELSEQLVANDFDFRTIVKWAVLARPFSADGNPSPDTLTKDIPKYGGIAFFSYVYEQLEHDPVQSVDRLAKAYQKPGGLTESARLSLNVKPVGKGLEIIDQMENGVLPNGLRIDDEVPEFARGWGVESIRVTALDRIANSKTLKIDQKIEHLYLLAVHRTPTRAEMKQAKSLFGLSQSEEQASGKKRSEREILQDLWWAICPR